MIHHYSLESIICDHEDSDISTLSNDSKTLINNIKIICDFIANDSDNNDSNSVINSQKQLLNKLDKEAIGESLVILFDKYVENEVSSWHSMCIIKCLLKYPFAMSLFDGMVCDNKYRPISIEQLLIHQCDIKRNEYPCQYDEYMLECVLLSSLANLLTIQQN